MAVPNLELLNNAVSTTLNGSINNSVTTVTVTTGSVFPSTGNFRVKVEDEIMLCTARSTNDLTVVRGHEGTTAASHASASGINAILTAGSLNRFLQDCNGVWGYDSQPPLGKLVDTDGKTLLTTSDFSWVNQGTATVTDQNGTIIIDAPAASGENCRVQVRTAPATTYSVIAAFQHCGLGETSSAQNFGLCLRQSTSGKFYGLAYGANGSGANAFASAVYKFTNATTFSTNLLARTSNLHRMPYLWMKMTDDGTNLLFSMSSDGVNWIQIASEARGSFMTLNGGVTGPDQVGFYLNNHGTTLYHCLTRLVHWSYV